MNNLPPPSQELVSIYENLNGVPDSIIKSAIHATSEAELNKMCKAFVGDRGGPANVRNVETAEGTETVVK